MIDAPYTKENSKRLELELEEIGKGGLVLIKDKSDGKYITNVMMFGDDKHHPVSGLEHSIRITYGAVKYVTLTLMQRDFNEAVK